MKTSFVVPLGAMALCLVGCIAPGSRIGHLALQGTLVDERDRPVRHETVEIVLPAAYGLGGLDAHFGEPADHGHTDRRFSATTDEQGQFHCDMGRILYHATMWFIPPIGMRPRRPPAPFLLVRVARCGGEFYAVQTWDGKFKVFAADGGELPTSKAHLVTLEARDAADESRDASTLGVLWLRIRGSDQGDRAEGRPYDALAASGAAADTPQAPKLDGSAPATSPTVRDRDPARPLPRTTAICQDPAAERCRQAPREEDCTAAGEHVFRVVIDTPADVETALAHCRAALAAPD